MIPLIHVVPTDVINVWTNYTISIADLAVVVSTSSHSCMIHMATSKFVCRTALPVILQEIIRFAVVRVN